MGERIPTFSLHNKWIDVGRIPYVSKALKFIISVTLMCSIRSDFQSIQVLFNSGTHGHCIS